MSLDSGKGQFTIAGLTIQFVTSKASKLEEVPAKVAAAVEGELKRLLGQKGHIGQALDNARAEIVSLKERLARANAPITVHQASQASQASHDDDKSKLLAEENEALRADVATMAEQLVRLQESMHKEPMPGADKESPDATVAAPKKRGRPRKGE
jgi:chromosome segregation ATPase